MRANLNLFRAGGRDVKLAHLDPINTREDNGACFHPIGPPFAA